MPPLVRLPQAPADVVAERRGNTVDVHFTVPSANTDGTRPANVASAEVYAITAPATVTPLTDAQLLKLGTRVGSVPVKAPRDPNLTAEPDEPDDEVDAPEGPGLDQGAVANISEQLTTEMIAPVDVPKDKKGATAPARAERDRPLLPAPPTVASRTYAALGASARGRKGPLSKRIVVPLVAPPPPPTLPVMAYDEKAITVTWNPVALSGSVQPAAPETSTPPTQPPAPTTPQAPPQSTAERPAPAAAHDSVSWSKPIADGPVKDGPAKDQPATNQSTPAAAEILPSRPIGVTLPTIAYNVYDASNPESVVKLTPTPIAEPRFSDPRIAWGEQRCYVVRTVETVGGLTIESDAAATKCEKLVDTFPPAVPKDVKAIPSEGAINLIWEPNTEKDLGGYIVMRGAAAPDAPLEPITPSPIQEPSFKDTVQAGVPYAYAVKAVDKAGNASVLSARVVESAR